MRRCEWPSLSDPLYLSYHDTEWGVPVHDDRTLFEYLSLESFQAGLSWLTILKKRENFRRAFSGFDPLVIASFGEEKVENLMADSSLIRNRLKILSVIQNASSLANVVNEFGSFNAYIWSFTDGAQIQGKWNSTSEVPSTSPISDKMSQDLKRRGFKFVGSTICYSFMQAVGLVNDHLLSCFRYRDIKDIFG